MALVEIDDAELAGYRRLHSTVQTIIRHSPKAAALMEEAHKLVAPKTPTPYSDRLKADEEPLNELRKTLAEIKAEREAEKAEREKREKLDSLGAKVDSDLARLRRSGWMDDAVDGVRKIMADKGIGDVMDAATIYERDNPPSNVATPSGQGAWKFFDGVGDGEVDLKKMIEGQGQSESLTDKMVNDTLRSVRGQRAA